MLTQFLNIAAALFLVFTNSVVMAQSQQTGNPDPHLEQIKVKLDLSDEQAKQLLPVLESSMQAQKRILSNYGIDLNEDGDPGEKPGFREAWAMKQELDAVRAETLVSVGDILSDKQLDAFKRMQEKRRAEMRERIRSKRE